jgi:hypothetical protein
MGSNRAAEVSRGEIIHIMLEPLSYTPPKSVSFGHQTKIRDPKKRGH